MFVIAAAVAKRRETLNRWTNGAQDLTTIPYIENKAPTVASQGCAIRLTGGDLEDCMSDYCLHHFVESRTCLTLTTAQ